MSDGQALFLILCLLYLSECFVWLAKRAVLFFPLRPGRWRASFSNQFLGNHKGGLGLLNPLVFSPAYLGHWAPLSLSPEGVCAFTLTALPAAGRPLQSGEALLYEAIKEVGVDGKYLTFNAKRFVQCANFAQAGRYAGLIGKLSRCPDRKREKLIRDFMAAQFRRNRASHVRRRAALLTTNARWTCAAFFGFLYIFISLLVLHRGLISVIIPAGIAMLIAGAIVTRLFFKTHKILYPALREERLSNSAKMILCPPVAIRAGDLLTLNALAEFHPLVLAELLLVKKERENFERVVVRDLRHPLAYELDDAQAERIVSWHLALEREFAEGFLKAREGGFEHLIAPPSREDQCIAYCPRCGSQFMMATEECPDCPGIRVIPFS